MAPWLGGGSVDAELSMTSIFLSSLSELNRFMTTECVNQSSESGGGEKE